MTVKRFPLIKKQFEFVGSNVPPVEGTCGNALRGAKMLNRSQITNLFECLFEILQEYANRDWPNAKLYKILSGTVHCAFFYNRDTIANAIFRSCLIPPIPSAEVPCEAYGICCV